MMKHAQLNGWKFFKKYKGNWIVFMMVVWDYFPYLLVCVGMEEKYQTLIDYLQYLVLVALNQHMTVCKCKALLICLDFQLSLLTECKCKVPLICLDFQPNFFTGGKCKALLICLDF